MGRVEILYLFFCSNFLHPPHRLLAGRRGNMPPSPQRATKDGKQNSVMVAAGKDRQHGKVAQTAEHTPFKRKVTGSNPAFSTKKFSFAESDL